MLVNKQHKHNNMRLKYLLISHLVAPLRNDNVIIASYNANKGESMVVATIVASP